MACTVVRQGKKYEKKGCLLGMGGGTCEIPMYPKDQLTTYPQ